VFRATFPQGTLLEQRAVYVRRETDMSLEQLQHAFKRSRAVPQTRWNTISACEHHSLCGLLRQLRMTLDCWLDIKAHERKQAFRYDFVGRTRMDMLWYGALGDAAWTRVLHKGHAVVPSGDAFHGLNDRFVLATRTDFEPYARLYEDLRLARAPWDKKRMPMENTAERSLRMQLDSANVTLAELELPACLLQASPGNPGCAYCKSTCSTRAVQRSRCFTARQAVSLITR
jgi:hypothetical protein